MSVVIISTVELAKGARALEGVLKSFIGAAAREVGLVREEMRAANQNMKSVEIGLDSAEEVAGGVPTGESVVFSGDGVTAEFFVDAAGKVAVRVSGEGTEDRLRELGQKLADRVVQQYAYHRLVTEMRSRNMNIVEEEVEADGTVRMRVRVYQG